VLEAKSPQFAIHSADERLTMSLLAVLHEQGMISTSHEARTQVIGPDVSAHVSTEVPAGAMAKWCDTS
jgi:hypothetical protein